MFTVDVKQQSNKATTTKPLGSKFFPLRVTPKFEVTQLAPSKYRSKMIFYLSEGMENCKISGKNQGILKWMLSGNPATAIASRRAKKDHFPMTWQQRQCCHQCQPIAKALTRLGVLTCWAGLGLS